MKEKDQYNLDEAIRELYQTEPLRRDFAMIVADKAFAARKTQVKISDKILLFALYLLIFASLTYGIGLLAQISATTVLIFIAAAVMIVGLSVKEYFVLLKRIGNAH